VGFVKYKSNSARLTLQNAPDNHIDVEVNLQADSYRLTFGFNTKMPGGWYVILLWYRSAFNWYWLVDDLQAAGFTVMLVNKIIYNFVDTIVSPLRQAGSQVGFPCSGC